MTSDEKYLDLFGNLHYLLGAMIGVFASIPIIHVIIGVAMVLDRSNSTDPAPVLVAWGFIGFGSAIIIIGWTAAILVIMAGYRMTKRKSLKFCMIVAGIECFFMPFGTIIGIFTLILLTKPETKRLFDDIHAGYDKFIEGQLG